MNRQEFGLNILDMLQKILFSFVGCRGGVYRALSAGLKINLVEII